MLISKIKHHVQGNLPHCLAGVAVTTVQSKFKFMCLVGESGECFVSRTTFFRKTALQHDNMNIYLTFAQPCVKTTHTYIQKPATFDQI